MTLEELIAYGKEQLDIFGGLHKEFIEAAVKSFEAEAHAKKAKMKAIDILKNDIEVCTPDQQAAVDLAVAELEKGVGDTIPREKLETAKKMIKARFMDSTETVKQNETRRAVCREFIEILEEVCK